MNKLEFDTTEPNDNWNARKERERIAEYDIEALQQNNWWLKPSEPVNRSCS